MPVACLEFIKEQEHKEQSNKVHKKQRRYSWGKVASIIRSCCCNPIISQVKITIFY